MSIITVASCLLKILSDEDIFMRCKSNQCRKTILQIMVTTTKDRVIIAIKLDRIVLLSIINTTFISTYFPSQGCEKYFLHKIVS